MLFVFPVIQQLLEAHARHCIMVSLSLSCVQCACQALASQKAKAKEREVKSKRSKAEDAWQDWCRMKSRQESIKKHQREVQQLEEARKNEQVKYGLWEFVSISKLQFHSL